MLLRNSRILTLPPERGCVPQSGISRSNVITLGLWIYWRLQCFPTCCGWSRTTQPRSGGNVKICVPNAAGEEGRC